jgi:protocatechuate 3,4-dioxygenase beta subunit
MIDRRSVSAGPSRRRARRVVPVVLVLAAAVIYLRHRWAPASDPASGIAARTPDSATSLRRPDARDAYRRRAASTVAGRVTDGKGAPLAAAQVCVSAPFEGLAPDDAAAMKCVGASSGGAYRIRELAAGRYEVAATAPGYRPATYRNGMRGDLDLGAGEQREGVDIVLGDRGALARGRVKDVGGGPIAGARIAILGHDPWPETSRSMAVTNEAGEWTAWTNDGGFVATARASGYAPASRSGSAPGLTVEMSLVPESVLRGRVVAVLEGGSSPQAGGGSSALSGVEGKFQISGLGSGRYQLVADGQDWSGRGIEGVLVGIGEVSPEVLVKVDRAYSVSGRVVSQDDRPCTDGGVVLTDERRQIRLLAAVKGDGQVTFGGVLPGTYAVQVHCRDRLAQDHYPAVTVEDRSVSALRWNVDAGAFIAGQVVDPAEAPLRGVTVLAAIKGGDPRAPRFDRQDTTGPDGRFRIQGLRSGRYAVTATGPEEPALRDPVEISVAPGQDARELRIVLERGGEIRGRVEDEDKEPSAGVQVSALGSVRELRPMVALSADDGSYRLAGLRPGEYRVQMTRGLSVLRSARAANATSQQRQSVTVRAGDVQIVNLTVESERGTIKGDVRDAQGAPLPDAFVRAEREPDTGTASGAEARYAVRASSPAPPVVTDLDGHFTATGLTRGLYTLRAYRKGGGEAIAEHVPAGGNVTIRIRAAARIEGVVTLAKAGTPDVFNVQLVDVTTGYRRSEGFFHNDGKFTVRDLPGGAYDLFVSAPEGTVVGQVSLREGEARTDLSLILDADATVRGQAVSLSTGNAVPGLVVTAQPVRGGASSWQGGSVGRRNVTDGDGRFEIGGVPAGRVWILASPSEVDSSYAPAAIVTEVHSGDGNDPIRLRVAQRRIGSRDRAGDLGFQTKTPLPDTDPSEFRWSVAAIRADGPAAASGMKVGDEIVSVDGYDVSALNGYLYPPLVGVAPGTLVKLGLSRGVVLGIVADKSM